LTAAAAADEASQTEKIESGKIEAVQFSVELGRETALHPLCFDSPRYLTTLVCS
jgi:hypothetical protein